ncbi:MAG: ACT domain-containing protein [Candidatus Omnitrophica bacterium]|nr:ACT domain-containing protein [Candidatus Omnitrophota bacterium]
MIKNAELGKEIVVTAPNKVGILAAIAKILADHGINVEGVAGYAVNNEATIMLVADDALRAKDALVKAGYKSATEKEVVVVDLENKVGALKGLSAKLAEANIDIRYTYGTVCAGTCPARLVLSTSSNEKALVALKGK